MIKEWNTCSEKYFTSVGGPSTNTTSKKMGGILDPLPHTYARAFNNPPLVKHNLSSMSVCLRDIWLSGILVI